MLNRLCDPSRPAALCVGGFIAYPYIVGYNHRNRRRCGGRRNAMMGSRIQTTAMFQYFCLDDWVPADHLLRAIDRHIDLRPIRQQLRPLYSEVGRPSIDPEVLLRILLIGYLYGITSERRLLDEVGLNLAYRWFTGLGFDQSIPDHSTFSKNRHGRFRDSSVFRDLFETIVQQCVNVGLVQGERLSVDGTVIAANASSKSRLSRDQLPEAAKVSRTPRVSG